MAKDKVIVFDAEDNTCETFLVKDVSDEAIETERALYYRSDANITQHLDIKTGSIIYTVNLDKPAKQEASILKNLRRSTALKRLFEFNVADKPDYFKYVPYIIIALLIFFR